MDESAAASINPPPRALAALYHAAGRAMVCDVTRLMVLERDQAREVPVDPRLQLRFLTPDEVRASAGDPASELAPEFAGRMATGLDRCFAALDGDRLLAYAWLATGSIEAEHNRGRRPASGVAVSFPADTAFVYNAFTRPSERGHHLYSAILIAALRELSPLGITRLLDTADWTNTAALRACRRAGLRQVGLVGRFGCGPLRLTLKPRGAARLGIRFGRDSDTHSRSDRPADSNSSVTILDPLIGSTAAGASH